MIFDARYIKGYFAKLYRADSKEKDIVNPEPINQSDEIRKRKKMRKNKQRER